MKLIFTDSSQNNVEFVPGSALTWRIAAYGLIKNSEGAYLMVKPSFDPKWQFPGGEVEIEEFIEDGLSREILEETGYKAIKNSAPPVFIRDGGFYLKHENRFCHSLQLLFECTLKEDSCFPELMPDEDRQGEVAWKKITELTYKNSQSSHWPFIMQLQKNSR